MRSTELPVKELALIYSVSPRQIRRWVEADLDVTRPEQLLEYVSRQSHPGRTLDRFTQNGAVELAKKRITLLSAEATKAKRIAAARKFS